MGGLSRRAVLGGTAAGVFLARTPAIAQTAPKRLVFATVAPPQEASAMAMAWMGKEINEKTKGALDVQLHPGTLITKELEVVNAVKGGNIAGGTPSGASATIFPEINVFLTPYLVRDYEHAYRMFNGKLGDQLDGQFQQKYGVKLLYFFDLGFRHFWNNKRPINDPKDLRGLRMRVQPSKVFADTVGGLGANAVPMAWAELYPAVQQGVVDGADLPIVNQFSLKAYEVAKYSSLTFHNYSPTMVVMNLGVWNGLSPEQQAIVRDAARGAQERVRKDTESVDNLQKAKELLEPKGMTVNAADLEAFRKVAQEKVWPAYQKQYAELWEEIVKAASA